MQYTRCKAQVQNKQGGKYQILDGSIVGKFISLRKGQYIKMQWKFKDWQTFSTVQLIFQDPEEDQCDLIINQTNIPKGNPKQKMQSGWRHHIIQPLSKLLGYPLKD